MPITHDELYDLGFRLTHACGRGRDGRIRFSPVQNGHKPTLEGCEPMVYAWMSPRGDFLESMYVGKAGLGVSQRLKQHESGFRHSSSGRKNLGNINRLIDSNRSLVVYARKAASAAILGVHGVNLYSVEEEAVHELLKPCWNRAEFATTRQKAGETLSAPETDDGSFEDDSLVIGGIDFTNLARTSLLRSFYAGLELKDRTRLAKLMNWMRGLNRPDADIKLVGGYENQPQAYNKVATLLLSPISKSGRAVRNAWISRVPLRCDDKFPLTVTLPLRAKAHSAGNEVISLGRHDCFRPLNLDDFLRHPDKFTTL